MRRSHRFARPMLACLLALAARIEAQTASDFATRVVSYNSTNAYVAPGGPAYTNPATALGAPSALGLPRNTTTEPVFEASQIVSIGFGGSLVLGFNRPIVNDPNNPGGYDFIVFGNAFYVGGNMMRRFQEPGRVEVGVDVNGNGTVDMLDLFYELRGGPQPPLYNVFGVLDPGGTGTTFGFTDVTPTASTGDPLVPDDPFTPGITSGSAGGDAFKLEWAVDAQGNSVALTQVDFIRITVPGNSWTTEIDAVALVRPTVTTPTYRIRAVIGGSSSLLGDFRLNSYAPGALPSIVRDPAVAIANYRPVGSSVPDNVIILESADTTTSGPTATDNILVRVPLPAGGHLIENVSDAMIRYTVVGSEVNILIFLRSDSGKGVRYAANRAAIIRMPVAPGRYRSVANSGTGPVSTTLSATDQAVIQFVRTAAGN